MTDGRLLEISVERFRSLQNITLPLGPLNVLVGPNGVGKSNVLEVFRFLADVIRTDLEPALELRGGLDELLFWGDDKPASSFRVRLTATWTRYSSQKAPDVYDLLISRRGRGSVSRKEDFTFKRTQGSGRRITVNGERVSVTGYDRNDQESDVSLFGIKRLSSGLSTLPRLTDDSGGTEVADMAQKLASFRVFDVDVPAARQPARFPGADELLGPDASNLAAFLLTVRERDEAAWARLVADAREVLPQLEDIDFTFPSGAGREVIVTLQESGLRRRTQLADASYGTVRLLGLLALLYDPKPPALTCVEEIDHGLHPQAIELLVERLREASERTQFLIVTHSAALADRLKPSELVVCERDDAGRSHIPAVSMRKIEEIVAVSEGLPLGELWFSGALGGSL